MNQDMYLELCEQTIRSVATRCNMEEDMITLQSETEPLTKGNLALFGHILLDLHEQYNIPITYQEFTQYQVFPTLKDVVNHFYEMTNKGVSLT